MTKTVKTTITKTVTASEAWVLTMSSTTSLPDALKKTAAREQGSVLIYSIKMRSVCVYSLTAVLPLSALMLLVLVQVERKGKLICCYY